MKAKHVYEDAHINIDVSDEWRLLGDIPSARTLLAALIFKLGLAPHIIFRAIACSVTTSLRAYCLCQSFWDGRAVSGQWV